MEYIIYCDESEKQGKIYSNFYGGALVRSIHYREVVGELQKFKKENNISGEMKWTKVTPNYLEKYKGLMDIFFYFIKEDKIKMRVMFQQNSKVNPRLINLTKEQKEDAYFKLYYQFFKHAFGLSYSNSSGEPIYVRTFFDQFPDKKEKVERFKEYIFNLQFSPEFRKANIKIRKEDIIEATSHDHVILQCVDIVTGAMYFRLNKLHKEKPEGSRVRGKRTRAKEDLYNHINFKIREITPNFNVGVSTSLNGNYANKWLLRYRHWSMIPNSMS